MSDSKTNQYLFNDYRLDAAIHGITNASRLLSQAMQQTLTGSCCDQWELERVVVEANEHLAKALSGIYDCNAGEYATRKIKGDNQ
jgi:hypothetical protein